MKPTCSHCRGVIPPEDVNVAADVAYCRACNQATPLSEILREGGEPRPGLDQPPPGAWLVNEGQTRVAGATNRSLGTAAGALFGALFWNAIVSIFVGIALFGTLRRLGVPLPAWLPAAAGRAAPMGTGALVFLWLFLTPFIAIGCFLASTVISSLWGRTEVRIEAGAGTIFTGVGSLGWRRRFDPASIRRITIQEVHGNNNARQEVIVLETATGKRLRFGSLLTDERRAFLAEATRQVLR